MITATTPLLLWSRFRFMVFNATFNNISVILWQSVSLIEEKNKTKTRKKIPPFTKLTYTIYTKQYPVVFNK
jgi:hypothetical protein